MFWKTKSLNQMTRAEWESLCDGCGKCCLSKLEDDETREIYFTNVACRLLDLHTCRCVSYSDRKRFVPDCQTLSPKNLDKLSWLPETCAYRLLSKGEDLKWWHPLVSGDSETVHQASVSVRGRAVSERETKNLDDYIVSWPER
ncbi:MAG: hypothetical protein CMF70_10320 [Magnetovibrio sp.]|nr:hypothetical protein [Magnetovibrio sp.]